MSTAIQETLDLGTAPIVLQMRPVLNLSEDQFFEFCQVNRDLRIERTEQGEMIVMAPAGGDSSGKNAELTRQLANWAKQNGTGKCFDSSCGYILPNSAVRSPDASWISHARLKTLTAEQRRKFMPLCPEFVIELRSPSDRLADVQAKMQEYVNNGVRLGLLLDPDVKRVYLYQPNQPVEILDQCETISCDSVLPGFELIVKEIW